MKNLQISWSHLRKKEAQAQLFHLKGNTHLPTKILLNVRDLLWILLTFLLHAENLQRYIEERNHQYEGVHQKVEEILLVEDFLLGDHRSEEECLLRDEDHRILLRCFHP